MWKKVVLLLMYLCVELLVLRLWEWCHYELMDHSFVVKPATLNVRNLKALLAQRGLTFSDVFEKNALSNLLTSSGRVTSLDVADASVSTEISVQQPLTQQMSRVISHSYEQLAFTGLQHFNELVEDSKDSAWLVHVIALHGPSAIDIHLWRQLIVRLQPFGVRFGLYDCKLDPRSVLFVCAKIDCKIFDLRGNHDVAGWL